MPPRYPVVSIGALANRLEMHTMYDPFGQTRRARVGMGEIDWTALLNPAKLAYDLGHQAGDALTGPVATNILTPSTGPNGTGPDTARTIFAKVNVNDALAVRSTPVVDPTNANVRGWLKRGEIVSITGKQSGIFVSIRTQSGIEGWAAHVAPDGSKEYLIGVDQPLAPLVVDPIDGGEIDEPKKSPIAKAVALALTVAAGAGAAYYGS